MEISCKFRGFQQVFCQGGGRCIDRLSAFMRDEMQGEFRPVSQHQKPRKNRFAENIPLVFAHPSVNHQPAAQRKYDHADQEKAHGIDEQQLNAVSK